MEELMVYAFGVAGVISMTFVFPASFAFAISWVVFNYTFIGQFILYRNIVGTVLEEWIPAALVLTQQEVDAAWKSGIGEVFVGAQLLAFSVFGIMYLTKGEEATDKAQSKYLDR